MRRVDHFFSLNAEQVIVQIGTQIVSVGSGHSHMANQTVLAEQVQITVNGSVTYFRIQLVHIIEYPVSRWVVRPCLYRL